MNDNLGVSEQTGAETKLELRVKYGSPIDSSATLPDISQDYNYNRASYNDGVWSYKRGSKETLDLYNQSDAIIAPITIYAVYTTNVDNIGDLIEHVEDSLQRARTMLDNYFLLNNEYSELKRAYDELVNLYNDTNSNTNDLLFAVTILDNLMNRIEPDLIQRDISKSRIS